MTDHRGFAIVTAALHALVQRAVAPIAPAATLRIGPPRAAAADQAGPQVSLALYHLAANAAARNADLPVRDPGGARRTAAAAFDLHYCVAVGGGARLAGEQLLGAIAAALAGQPLLTPAMLAAVCAADGAYPELSRPGSPAAGPADASAEGPVRLTPHYPAPAESAALWSGLFALPYQPSLHIVATPVLIAAASAPQG